ncbi:hypothetical protein K7432_002191 [Basidiobolus ranarum]|uniref:PHD-type domain-containing protein n=1 Tax=Basidiobolus ranarum TaxID=34480 RepID=A0ABR2W8M5_9FUNG
MYIRQDYWIGKHCIIMFLEFKYAKVGIIALNASSLSMANTDHPSSNYIDNSAVPNGSNDSAYAETYEYYDDMADDEVYDIIACHICNNGDSDPGNQILLCDGCNGAIHQLCQIPVITETEIEYDPWYCIKCWRARNPPVSVDGMDDLKRRRIE